MEGIFDRPVLGADVDEWDFTPDYERFEERMVQDLTEEFTPTGYRCLKRRLFEFDDGVEICPDAVVVVNATTGSEVECVADAKLRKELRKQHIDKMITYKTRLSAGEARIYVPSSCRVPRSVHHYANENGIVIRDDLVP